MVRSGIVSFLGDNILAKVKVGNPAGDNNSDAVNIPEPAQKQLLDSYALTNAEIDEDTLAREALFNLKADSDEPIVSVKSSMTMHSQKTYPEPGLKADPNITKEIEDSYTEPTTTNGKFKNINDFDEKSDFQTVDKFYTAKKEITQPKPILVAPRNSGYSNGEIEKASGESGLLALTDGQESEKLNSKESSEIVIKKIDDELKGIENELATMNNDEIATRDNYGGFKAEDSEVTNQFCLDEDAKTLQLDPSMQKFNPAYKTFDSR
jgi:hypothetical protein